MSLVRRFPLAAVLTAAWFAASVALAGGLPADAPAQDVAPVPQISFCADPEGTLALEEAMACDFRTFNEIRAGSTPRSVRWLRVEVPLSAPAGAGLAIHVGPHFLRDIRLHESSAGGWQVQQAGASLPGGGGRALPGGYRFLTHPGSDMRPVYYLRVQAAGLTHVRVSVEPVAGGQSGLVRQQIGLGMQLGALGLMMVFALVSFASQPDPMMGRFAVYAGNLILCLLAGSGLLAQYVFQASPWLDGAFFLWALCLRLAAWVWLNAAFFKGLQTPRWYRWVCRGAYAAVGLSCGLVAIDQPVLVQPLMLLAIVVFSVAQIVALFRTPDIHPFYRRALLWGFIVTDLLIVVASLAVVFPVGIHDFPTLVARITDFATPLVVLAIILFKQRLDLQELGQVRQALSEARGRAEMEREALAERRVLIDMLTHELKNPLASISLAMGSLSHQLTDAEAAIRRRLENVERSIRGMDTVIERCALMNQVDQRQMAIRPQDVALSELLQQMVQGAPAPQRIVVDVPPGLRLMTDPQLLRIVLSNLVENAVKYARADSLIQLRVQAGGGDGKGLRTIEVESEVGTLGAPDPARVFEKYYRNPLTHERSGSGLGLYLVREICRMLGGRVQFAGDGRRVRFILEFPA